MSQELSFLPAVASPILSAVSSRLVEDFPSVNFLDFLDAFPSLRGDRAVLYDAEAGSMPYKMGIDYFRDYVYSFTRYYFYEYFIDFFRENADISICDADNFRSRLYPRKERHWLIDVYAGTIFYISEKNFKESTGLDISHIYSRGFDHFYIRKTSVMYDDLNRRDDFIYNLHTVYDEYGVCYYVPSNVSYEGLMCEQCGKFVLSEANAHVVTDDGTLFCSAECAIESEYGQCAKCGKWESVYDMIYVENTGESYCSECVDRYVFQCPACQNFYDYSTMSEDIITEDGTHFCCVGCAVDSGYYQCENCGAWVGEDELRHSESSDRYLCDDCYTEEEEDNAKNLIHEYGYKPHYKFNCTPEENNSKNLYFGVEIETEYNNRDDFYSSVRNLDNISSETGEMIYLKHDGSLSSEGIEIVTMPCTLDYLKSAEGRSVFNRIFEELSAASPSSDAGTHVHMSRAGFTENMSVCLELFFMRNAIMCQTICGRGSVYYAKYDTEREVEDLDRFSPDFIDDRYRCINWNNDRTVEIRAFSAITTIEQFYKNVEFCHAVYQYIKKNADNLELFQYGNIEDGFLQYVKGNADRYNHLSAFINENF